MKSGIRNIFKGSAGGSLRAKLADFNLKKGDITRIVNGGDIDELSQLMSKGLYVDEIDNTLNMTPLLAASQYKHHHIVKFLVELGADADRQNYYGVTPLMFSIENHETAELLVKKSKANVNLKSNCKVTALMGAAAKGSAETVKLLVKHGATIGAKDMWGRTALHYAEDLGREDIVKVLKTAQEQQKKIRAKSKKVKKLSA